MPRIAPPDLIMINESDLAPIVAAGLDLLPRDSRRMRRRGPVVLAEKVAEGMGADTIIDAVVEGMEESRHGAA